jgi:hypothetical protein
MTALPSNGTPTSSYHALSLSAAASEPANFISSTVRSVLN